jgi:integrase
MPNRVVLFPVEDQQRLPTVASLLKVLGVPARDAQIILGHSRPAVTLEIYTHADDEAKLDALTRLHGLFV